MATPSERARTLTAKEYADTCVDYVRAPMTEHQRAFARYAATERGIADDDSSDYLAGVKAAGLWERFRALRHVDRVDEVLAVLGAKRVAADDLFLTFASAVADSARGSTAQGVRDREAFVAGVEAQKLYSRFQKAVRDGGPNHDVDAAMAPAVLSALIDPDAVRAAIAEFDQLGRAAFLVKYGFGAARTYLLVRGDQQYDSTAIAGAALAYQDGVRQPLRPEDFSGGEGGAVARLRALGFTVHSAVPAREIDARAVHSALAEYDALGRDRFLETYEARPSTTYRIVLAGREYDAKPVVQAAWNIAHPDQQPLRANDFRGDQRTIAEPLRELGFWVENVAAGPEAAEPPLGSDPARYLSAAADIESDELDVPAATRRRREQQLLRGALGLYDSGPHQCGLCGRWLPGSLLVCAHIKKRSACEQTERLDLLNVAMPVCLLGCDALYERGLISVDREGTIRVGAVDDGVHDLQAALEVLRDRRAPGWTPQRSVYFAWHTENTAGRDSVGVDGDTGDD